jgi:signal transduction histidine kinase
VEVRATIDKEIRSMVERVHEVQSEVDLGFICDDMQTLITECQEGADRVRQIVADLKDYAHPGHQQPQHTDINASIGSTLNMLRNELKYKAAITKDYGKIPEVLCYPQLVNQVFMNLILNAAQSIEQKGEIRISTQKKVESVHIRIEDTGCGMTPEHVKRVFEPFFTTKPVGAGTGLGLHIAYQIVQQHQGQIDVTSQLGKGSSFIVQLPIAPKLGAMKGPDSQQPN